MKIFNSHLSTQLLADVADDKVPLAPDSEQHLNNCSYCAGELARLRRVVATMRGDDSSDAPAGALAFARNIFRSQQGFEVQPKTRTQKILANLRIDLSAFAPAFGERSAGSAEERQMLFAAGDYDLDLRIKRAENGFAVRGQVLGELANKCLVRLETANFAVETAVSETGAFSFSPISSIDNMQVLLVFVE